MPFIILLLTVYISRALLLPISFKSSQKTVDIPKGASAKTIATLLEKKKFIKNSTLFYYYLRITGKDKHLNAGLFVLNTSDSPLKIATILQEKSGKKRLIKVTIPEGFNISEIAARLAAKKIVKKETFINYVTQQAKTDFKAKYPFIKTLPVQTLEGYLFPDTYFLPKPATPKLVVDRMLAQFNKQIVPLWQAAPTHNKKDPKQRFNFHEVLTVASMIEKEAQLTHEMTKISAVF